MNTGIKAVLLMAQVDISGIFFGENVDGTIVTSNDLLREIIADLGFTLFTRDKIGTMYIPEGEPYIFGWDEGDYVHVTLKISGNHDASLPDSSSAIIRLNDNSGVWKTWNETL